MAKADIITDKSGLPMRIWLFWLALLWAAIASAVPESSGNSSLTELTPAPLQSRSVRMTADMLSHYHYKTVPLDDVLSGKIFDQYLKAIDPERLFFDQSDVDGLSKARTVFDDAIARGDLRVPFLVFNTYLKRVIERYDYARTLLKTHFDFSEKEFFQIDRSKEPWAKNEEAVRDLWRKRIKNDWLRLRLAGKDDKSIVDLLDRRYETYVKRINQMTSDDAFQTFMNAYTMAIEPHTNYLGPRAAKEFDISMRLSLAGIGAVLAEKDDYTTIRELVPGGPAALSGQLQVGDRIVGVSQSEGGVVTDVMGWRMDDTVALIRGTPDSLVVLDVLPANAGPDGKHRLISLIRKKITLEEQAAKKSIRSVTDGATTRRIGVIALPMFYEDFEGRQKGIPDYKSASRDVQRLLGELKVEKVDAVLLDLRNNGGGSLIEAIALTGLFIGKGPVVQHRDAKGVVTVSGNPTSGIAWSGPLGVLINRGSASASEIFAAAIQDYGRGLVIGEPSFGKGTVQAMINLDQIAKNNKPQFGELKLTIAQFFRINGGTTQLRGVTPDFIFPTASDANDFGEASLGNALPWMQVKATDYSPAGDLKSRRPILLTRNEAREKSDKDFLCLQDDIAEFKRQRKKNQISLNEAERRQERNAEEIRVASCDPQRDPGKSARADARQKPVAGPNRARRDDGLQPYERTLATELADEKARKDAKDVLLNEAVNILGDEVDLLESHASVAARARESSPLNLNR